MRGIITYVLGNQVFDLDDSGTCRATLIKAEGIGFFESIGKFVNDQFSKPIAEDQTVGIITTIIIAFIAVIVFK